MRYHHAFLRLTTTLLVTHVVSLTYAMQCCTKYRLAQPMCCCLSLAGCQPCARPGRRAPPARALAALQREAGGPPTGASRLNSDMSDEPRAHDRSRLVRTSCLPKPSSQRSGQAALRHPAAAAGSPSGRPRLPVLGSTCLGGRCLPVSGSCRRSTWKVMLKLLVTSLRASRPGKGGREKMKAPSQAVPSFANVFTARALHWAPSFSYSLSLCAALLPHLVSRSGCVTEASTCRCTMPCRTAGTARTQWLAAGVTCPPSWQLEAGGRGTPGVQHGIQSSRPSPSVLQACHPAHPPRTPPGLADAAAPRRGSPKP
jgi:hypothetical protein